MTDPETTAAVLHAFCPMHVRVNATGHITGTGATLPKMRTGSGLVGQRFLEVFEVNRPRVMTHVGDLLSRAGTRMHFQFRVPPRTGFTGVAIPDGRGGAIVNLSLGISVVDAVRDYALTGTDFAATDLTTELLFLVEANAAAMAASRHLNLRLQGAKIAAEEQAFTDTLTGLKNRRALDHVLARLSSAETSFALMHLDLDYFKAVNDTLGHAAGDLVLQTVAQRMVKETRDKDTVARVGGDEFVLILGELDDRKRLSAIARRLINRLEEPVLFEGQPCKVSASIGIALSSQRPDREMAGLIEDADAALYAAKNAGRGCFRFFEGRSGTPMQQGPAPANQQGIPGRGAADQPKGAAR